MQIFDKLEDAGGDTSIALGYFDGIHLGHQAVILGAVNGARDGLIPTVFTFKQHAQAEVSGSFVPLIIDSQTKERILKNMGIKLMYKIDFKSIMKMNPNEFVDEVLINKLRVKKVYCGFNYRFGVGGNSTSADLKRICSKFNVDVIEVLPVKYANKVISSTRIRSSISDGDMQLTNKLLGRELSYYLEVIHGNKVGRTLGIPTLNQRLPLELVLPKFGSYVSIVKIKEKTTWGVTNIGVKPTIGGCFPTAETWLPEYDCGMIYGEKVEVKLIKFLRREQKFSNLTELKYAITKDSQNAKLYLSRYFI